MFEFRITSGYERAFKLNPQYIDETEFARFLDEIPDRGSRNYQVLEYNGKRKHIRQGDIAEIRKVIAEPCYLERRKVLRAKKLILNLLEQRGAMKVENLCVELGLSHDIVLEAVKELSGRNGFLELIYDLVKHKFVEV